MAKVNERLRGTVRRAVRRSPVGSLLDRVEALEAEIQELRAQNLRLAEIADVIQELLVPLASRDQARIDAALDSFPKSL